MSIDISKSITCTATVFGANGPYQVGIEYVVGDDHVHHVVRRPIVRREFAGYGLTYARYGEAIERISHDGPMTEWRIGDALQPGERPSNPPRINLPDEEHGCAWGDPIDAPTTEPTRWYWAGMGREISEQEAREAMAAYRREHPEALSGYYALIGASGERRDGFASEYAAARWLAERIGMQRGDLWLEDRSSSCGTEIEYDVLARSSRPHAVDGRESVGTIGSTSEIEPAPGWEERAVERARREGII